MPLAKRVAKSHLALVELAEEAITAVFDDTDVPQETTLGDMQELIALCEMKVDALKSDIKKRGNSHGKE